MCYADHFTVFNSRNKFQQRTPWHCIYLFRRNHLKSFAKRYLKVKQQNSWTLSWLFLTAARSKLRVSPKGIEPIPLFMTTTNESRNNGLKYIERHTRRAWDTEKAMLMRNYCAPNQREVRNPGSYVQDLNGLNDAGNKLNRRKCCQKPTTTQLYLFSGPDCLCVYVCVIVYIVYIV